AAERRTYQAAGAANSRDRVAASAAVEPDQLGAPIGVPSIGDWCPRFSVCEAVAAGEQQERKERRAGEVRRGRVWLISPGGAFRPVAHRHAPHGSKKSVGSHARMMITRKKAPRARPPVASRRVRPATGDG